MTLTIRGAGAIVAGTTAAITPAYPTGVAAGDAVLLNWHAKPSTVTAPAITGWTKVVDRVSGGGTAGAGTGPTRHALYRKDTVGAETGTVTVPAVAAANMVQASILAIGKTLDAWDLTYSAADRTVAATTGSHAESPAVFEAAGDIETGAVSASANTNLGSQTFASTGATFGTAVEHVDAGTNNGQAGRLSWMSRPVTGGVATAATTYSTTATAATTLGVIIIRARETAAARTGSGTGSLTFSGSAVGSAPSAPASSGSGSGSLAFAGSATGKREAKATGSGTVTITGTSSGTTVRRGSGSGSVAFAGAATGKRPPKASGNGTLAFVGTGTGSRSPKAGGSGTFVFTGSGIGNAPGVGMSEGTGVGSWSFVGSGVGKRQPVASGTSSWSLTATAVGYQQPVASGVGLLDWLGAGVGSRPFVPTQFEGRILSASLAIPTALGSIAVPSAGGDLVAHRASARLSILHAKGVLG